MKPVTRAEIARLAQTAGEHALAALVQIFRDENNPPTARIQAAEAVLSRGYGKPAIEVNQQIEVRDVRALPISELQRIVASGDYADAELIEDKS